MKLNLKKPKYVLPLILLPFLCLLNYSFKSFSKEEAEIIIKEAKGDILEIGDVSDQVKKRQIDTKFDATKNRFKRSDGYTAIQKLTLEEQVADTLKSLYNEKEKRMLDSIDLAMKTKFSQPKENSHSRYTPFPSKTKEDQDLVLALEQVKNRSEQGEDKAPLRQEKSNSKYDDPIALFKEQMAVVDSITKANDPEYQRNLKLEEQKKMRENQPKIKQERVKKGSNVNELFNTVMVETSQSFIKAIIDEEIKKGTIGNRLRIRILEDILVGDRVIKKGTYLYAIFSGFDQQRVKLTITSVMANDKIYNINLSIFDHDGIEGLYVPASAFREFSKDLGSNSTGGMNIQMNQDPSTLSQLYMSSLQRMFTSTSQAVSKNIRQNKANIKYGTMIFLIDPNELKDYEKPTQ